MITAIDPNTVRQSGRTVSAASGSQDFSVFMGAMAPAGAEGTRVAGQTDQHAAVTQAAMTGLSGASAPYYAGPGIAGVSTASSPLAYNLGGAQPATGAGTPVSTGAGGTTGTGGAPFSNPSQDFLEKDYLLREMHDQSLNMLVLQAQVQDQNRQFTLVSNMLQNRDRTLQNMIQNIGRT